ncbi:MAG: acyl-CoA dehydratase activase-related protein [Firmicutes bacterium]|nr:acyl-CoA dehydratase activase-related protein [Bacillota bacterium]
MPVKVGIPRALLYYYYYPQWETFFRHLGVETVVSRETTRGLLENGLKSSVDEACLPVKLAVGHVMDLRRRADYIFVPRIVSTARREYICPKFLGFPDMVRHTVEDLPPLIDYNFNLYNKGSNPSDFYYRVGRLFTRNPARIWMAYNASRAALKQHFRHLLAGVIQPGGEPISGPEDVPGGVSVAVIGHPYNIYDRYISMNMIDKLNKSGARVLTADQLTDSVIRAEAQKLPKKLFWTVNQRMIGAAYHFFGRDEIHGLIHVASFGCGPDSFTGELIERHARNGSRKPLLNLTLDEHTGEAGLVTRLEAFLDMVRWRRNLADVAATL